MKIVDPKVEVWSPLKYEEMIRHLERCGRVCYKSEDKMTDESAEKLMRFLIANKHYSVLEHASITVKFLCDRGVSHELVRHRIGSYSQESTRYVNHKGGMEVIKPPMEGYAQEEAWMIAMRTAENSYKTMIEAGAALQIARSVLPNSLKTEVVTTFNIREWRHVFMLRGVSKRAHPQMRQVIVALLNYFKKTMPCLFDDLPLPEGVVVGPEILIEQIKESI